jgi:hypothetical protein
MKNQRKTHNTKHKEITQKLKYNKQQQQQVKKNSK